MQKIHLSVPDDLHQWIKDQATKDGRTIRGLLLKILTDKKKESENG